MTGPVGNGALISKSFVITTASIFDFPDVAAKPVGSFRVAIDDVNSLVSMYWKSVQHCA
jgi:hypothetical protein